MSDSLASHILELVRKYSGRGILLDTNVLLLLVIGRHDENRIETFKRTNTFTKKDFNFLTEFLRGFQKLVATPHILTEVSNLAGNLADPQRTACFRSFANDIRTIDEHTDTARSISATSVFERLGITDASISLALAQRFLVLTDDLSLYVHLVSNGIDAINFNHIRPVG